MRKIETAVYVHKSAIDQLRLEYPDAYKYAQTLSLKGIEYDVVKWDFGRRFITFIMCPDWDTAREPLVGDALRVDVTNLEVKRLRSRGQVYHHKHEFVNADYSGFDIEESKAWSTKWQSILPPTKQIKNRISYKKDWLALLKEYGLQ